MAQGISSKQLKNMSVKEHEDNCIILEPEELIVPESISIGTLTDMDRAVSNFKKGETSPCIDLSDV